MPEITDWEALFPREALRRPAVLLPTGSLPCDASRPASRWAALDVPFIPEITDFEDRPAFAAPTFDALSGLTRPARSCPDLELEPCIPEITDALLDALDALPVMAGALFSEALVAGPSPACADTGAVEVTGLGARATCRPISADAAVDVIREDVDSVDVLSP